MPHRFLVCRATEVVGLITRHDLLSETIEDRFQGLGQYTTSGNTMNGTEARSPSMPGDREEHTTAYTSSYGFLSHRPRPPPTPTPLPALPRNGTNSSSAYQHVGLG